MGSKKLGVRVYCGCGWEKFIFLDEKLTNDQAIQESQKDLDEHTITAHAYKLSDQYKHIGHETIKI